MLADADADFDAYVYEDEPDIIAGRYALVRDILALPPTGPTGEWEYSSLGYVVAGAMAERLTGQSWETLMEMHLFSPLGMTTVGHGWPGTLGAVDQPWAHQLDEMGAWTPLQPSLPDTIGPAGAGYMSIEDWAKFIALWFPSQTPAILDRAALDELLVPHDGFYAAGWFVGDFSYAENPWPGGPGIYHYGAGGEEAGFSATVRILPNRGIAYVAFANASSPFEQDGFVNEVFSVLDSILTDLNDDPGAQDISNES